MASGPITSWQIDGETIETATDIISLGSKITADSSCSHEIKTLAPWKKTYDKPRQHIKMQTSLCWQGPYSQSYGFASGCVWTWDLDHKEGWAPKNWCFRIVVVEKTLESPLDCRDIKPVNPKGNQSWRFIGRTDVEDETPILGHMMRKTDSFAKTLMLGKIEGRRRRG